MFFVLSGASTLLSMNDKQSLWKVMLERISKLLIAFFFGYLIMALPVCFIMLLYREGTIINASRKNWMDVLFTSPGQLYFLPYMFVLWFVHLPLLCVMKSCYEHKAKKMALEVQNSVGFELENQLSESGISSYFPSQVSRLGISFPLSSLSLSLSRSIANDSIF